MSVPAPAPGRFSCTAGDAADHLHGRTCPGNGPGGIGRRPTRARQTGPKGRPPTAVTLGWLLAVVAGSGLAAQAPAMPDVQVRTSVSQTAVWVGDRVTYEIELRCAPGLDVLAQDLAKDKIAVEGLEIVDVETLRDMSGDGIVHRARFILTPAAVTDADLRVGPVTVRYFKPRPGQPESAPTGEVDVPSTTLALRSTLTASGQALHVRDTRVIAPSPRAYALLRPVGLGLVLLSFAPLALVVVNLARRWHQPDARRRARRARASSRAELEDVKALDVSTDEDRRRAFDRLDGLVRTHLGGVSGLTAEALTPTELERELQRRNTAFPAPDVRAILEACHAARYGRPGDLPARPAWDAALRAAEKVVAISPR